MKVEGGRDGADTGDDGTHPGVGCVAHIEAEHVGAGLHEGLECLH